jgi:hypothetical protein
VANPLHDLVNQIDLVNQLYFTEKLGDLEDNLNFVIETSLRAGLPATLYLELALSWSLYLWRRNKAVETWRIWIRLYASHPSVHPSSKAALEDWLLYTDHPSWRSQHELD